MATASGDQDGYVARFHQAFGPLRAMQDGLGWVRASFCPHYDGEPGRRPAFREAVGGGVLGSGWAADDGAALHVTDGRLVRSVSERAAATTYRVERRAGGTVETRLVSDVLR